MVKSFARAALALAAAGSAGVALAASTDNWIYEYSHAECCYTESTGSLGISVPATYTYQGLYATVSLATTAGSVTGSAQNAPPLWPDQWTYYTQAMSQGIGEFAETFTIGSAVLPVGTPVQLRLSMMLNGNAGSTGIGTPAPDGSNVTASWGPGRDYPLVFLRVGYEGSPPGSYRASATLDESVGGTITLVGWLRVSPAGASAGGAYPVSTTSFASGTADFYLDAVTADVGIASASGWNYASTVPEPPLAWLWLGGGAALWVVRRRRCSEAH